MESIYRLTLVCCIFVQCGAISEALAVQPSGKPIAAPAASASSTNAHHLNPLFRPLLAYLRCESPVARNRFNEAAKPEILSSIDKPLLTGKSPSGVPTFPLRVWNGIVAQIEVLAGYGSFVMIQHYPKGSAPMLLRSISEAGWAMKNSTLAEQTNTVEAKLPGADLIGFYTATSNDNDIPRTIAVVEADLSGEGGPALIAIFFFDLRHRQHGRVLLSLLITIFNFFTYCLFFV